MVLDKLTLSTVPLAPPLLIDLQGMNRAELSYSSLKNVGPIIIYFKGIFNVSRNLTLDTERQFRIVERVEQFYMDSIG